MNTDNCSHIWMPDTYGEVETKWDERRLTYVRCQKCLGRRELESENKLV